MRHENSCKPLVLKRLKGVRTHSLLWRTKFKYKRTNDNLVKEYEKKLVNTKEKKLYG